MLKTEINHKYLAIFRKSFSVRSSYRLCSLSLWSSSASGFRFSNGNGDCSVLHHVFILNCCSSIVEAHILNLGDSTPRNSLRNSRPSGAMTRSHGGAPPPHAPGGGYHHQHRGFFGERSPLAFPRRCRPTHPHRDFLVTSNKTVNEGEKMVM